MRTGPTRQTITGPRRTTQTRTIWTTKATTTTRPTMRQLTTGPIIPTATYSQTTLDDLITGFWIWVAISALSILSCVVAFIKIISLLRRQNQQCLPLLNSSTVNTSIGYHSIPTTQTSISMVSSLSSTSTRRSLTPPSSSTPIKSNTNPFISSNDREPSPEPFARPMEMIDLPSVPSSHVASRIKTQTKKKLSLDQTAC